MSENFSVMTIEEYQRWINNEQNSIKRKQRQIKKSKNFIKYCRAKIKLIKIREVEKINE